MNLILLYPTDMITETTASLSDRRFQHISQVQKPEPGQSLRVGMLNGDTGTGIVTALSADRITLEIELDTPPPAPLPVTMLLALPRPKMLKRTLQTITSMGVKQLYLINAYKVDKSYWSSPVLSEESLHEQLLLGLEQAGDTLLPRIHLRKRFKPFVEDELPAIAADTRALLAHPYHAIDCPAPATTPTTLAVGPEGGFTPYEVEKLQQAGLQSIHIGRRILRVENAVPALLSRLFPV